MTKPAAKKRKPTNVSLDAALVEDAKTLGVSVSRSAEKGLEDAVREARWAKWREENSDAIRSYNEWVEKNGLPLEKYPMF